MDQLKERLGKLSLQQRMILAKKFNLSISNNHDNLKCHNLTIAPLSYSQERIWLLEQLVSNSAVNIIAGIATYSGKFNVEYFYRAVTIVTERHEILRTAIKVKDGIPYQQINPPTKLLPNIFDLEHLPYHQQQLTINEIIIAESKRPFDLANGELFRVIVLKITSTEHRVLVCIHHIISDGWSTSILLQEVSSIYLKLIKIEQVNESKLAVQYADFSIWQRGEQQQNQINEQISSWIKYLEGLPPRLALPVDKLRPSTPSYNGGRVHFDIAPELILRLKTFAAKENITPFMLLFSIYAVLLYRFSNQEDFAIGVPIAGRDHQELESLIGCFLNLLVLRVQIFDSLMFTDLVKSVKKDVLFAFSHKLVPFEKLVSMLNPIRDVGLSPLFQAVFSLEHDPTTNTIQHNDFSVEFEETYLGYAKYDLALELTWSKRDSQLSGWFDYSSDIFDKETIESMASCFVVLIEDALAQPECSVGGLSMLTQQQQNKLVMQLNQTATEYPRYSTIQDIFSVQAMHHPKDNALILDGWSLSYHELESISDKLAAKIITKGIVPGTLIGLYMKRSAEAIISIIAILKSGCAYLPINYADPKKRILHILNDSHTNYVFTDSAGVQVFEGINSIEPILFESNIIAGSDAFSSLEDCVNKINIVQHQDNKNDKQFYTSAAYVMYTSGSTGNPKGVVVTHRNVIRLVCSTNYASLQSNEIFLLLAPLAFDATTFEIWGALLNGATLVIAPDKSLGFDEIAALIEQHNVTTLWLTAGLFHAMVEEDLIGLKTLRQLIVGGDILSNLHVKKFLTQVPNCKLINGYGPTECTTFSCCHTVTLADMARFSIPIGKPIANTTVYILDKYLKPVPIGAIGDLYIGGDGVSSGYIYNEELTKEKFITNPYAIDSHANMYNSGDRARYFGQGLVEFRGRCDEQVKLRGFRIELSEIEAALSKHPCVKNAAVTFKENTTRHDKYLCAYLVLAELSGQEQTINWREFLLELIPEYMVPSKFIFLTKLPLTVNGKVDKQQLLRITDDPVKKFVEPVGEIECKLANIWQELLRIDKVGRYDNFFAIGGDSIRVSQLISRLSQQGFHISTQNIFSRQTLAGIASVIEPIKNCNLVVDAPPLGLVPLTPIQKWFFQIQCANYSHWNQSVLFTLLVPYTPESLRAALKLVVMRHDVFRLRFKNENGSEWRQYLVEEAKIEFMSHDLGQLPEIDKKSLMLDIINQTHKQLDISDGPLIRAVLFTNAQYDKAKLFMVAHHLVIDQVSWYIFFEDLQVALEASMKHNLAQFKHVALPFSYWARNLNTLYTIEKLTEYNKQWISLPWEDTSQIVVDFVEGSNLELDAKTFNLQLDLDNTLRLKGAQNVFHTRVDDFIIMALCRAIATWCDSKIIQIDNEIIGRNTDRLDLDISQSIGWFTVIYPILLSIDIEQDLASFIKNSKELLRQLSIIAPSFGILKYNETGIPPHTMYPNSQIIFNFLGEITEQESHLVDHSLLLDKVLCDRNPEACRTYEIIITAQIVAGRLLTTFEYSSNRYTPKSINNLAEFFMNNLNQLIDYCLAMGVGQRTPSDFPMANLNQTEIDHLLSIIPPEQVEDIYVLSPLQEGLLFYVMTNPSEDTYLVQFICDITGNFVPEMFKQAWDEILVNYSSLRSSFHYDYLSHPVQVVHTDCKLSWNCVSLVNSDKNVVEEQLRQYVEADRNISFNFSQAPLMRATIIQIAADKWRFVWTYHHILLDGWSMSIILNKVFNIYKSHVDGIACGAIQTGCYRDFIATLQNRDKNRSLEVWKNYLAGFIMPTVINLFQAQSNTSSSNTATSPIDVSLEVLATADLLQYAKSKALTLATIIQGLWAIILGIFSAKDDVLFGNVVSGRTPDLRGVDTIVGSLINTVPQRVKIELDKELTRWLLSIQNQQAGLADHTYVKLVDIQNASELMPNMPLFETTVVIENYPFTNNISSDPALQISDFMVIERVEFPITLMVIPGECINLRVFYDNNRFSRYGVSQVVDLLLLMLRRLPTMLQDATVQQIIDVTKILDRQEYMLLKQQIDGSQAISAQTIQPTDYVAPRGSQEKILCDIWQGILKKDKVGIDDNFYLCGGNSLLIMTMRSRILQSMQLDVSIGDLLQYPTVRELGQFLSVPSGIHETRLSDAANRAKMRVKKGFVMRKTKASSSYNRGQAL